MNEIAEAGYLSPSAVFIDGTHIKANANNKKKLREEVPVASKRYAKELMKEVNSDREEHGKKSFDDEDSNEPPKSSGPNEKFPEAETIVADSAYKTPHICKKAFDDNRVLSTAYKRPMTIKDGHEWWKYVYDEQYDCIICPEYADLYKRRKETIERVFADAKEKHAMRYTHYRGLAQVSNWVRLKFAAMKLKKFAKRKWLDNYPSNLFDFILLRCSNFTKNAHLRFRVMGVFT